MKSSRLNFRLRHLVTLILCALSALLGSWLSVASTSSSSSSSVPRKSPLNAGHVAELRVAYQGEPTLSHALQSDSAKARALASADLDRDGAADVVAGYTYNGTGIVSVQRGNPDAFAPKDDSVFQRMQDGYNPDSLLPSAETFATPEPIDFLQVGDFNQDSSKDVLVAARGGGLYLMAGDGKGGLGSPEQVTLPGTVTALEAGEFNAPDGRTDVAVGVTGPNGPTLLIFQEPAGLLHSAPLVFQLKSEATSLQFGALDDDAFADLAVATGGEISLIHGCGRKSNKSLESRIESITIPYQTRSLALGAFVWDRKAHAQIAVLADDGSLHILGRGKLVETPFSKQELADRARSRSNLLTQPYAEIESAPSWDAGWAEGWTPIREFTPGSAVGAGDPSQLQLKRTHISFHETDDLLVLGNKENRVNVLSQIDHKDDVQTLAVSGSDDLTTSSIDVPDAPIAVLTLPQKLNGERNLVVLSSKHSSADLVTIMAVTITVDRTDDPSGAALTAASACTAAANDCSLRGAVQFANANPGTTISLGSNTYTLSISGTGGCTIENSTTGNTIGDLEINETTTITGVGQANTIIRQAAATNDRVICMDVPLTTGKTFSFSGLTITGGRDTSINGGAGILGGAKDTTLNLTNVTFANNQFTGGNAGGGGGLVTGGSMNVTNCTFGAANNPGANRNDLTLANASTMTSGGGLGYTSGDPAGSSGAVGTLTIIGTTFTHNTTGGIGGGGLDVFGRNLSTPTVNISTSVFSNNQGTGIASGGGIINESANLTIATTSLTANSANNRGGGLYVGGGTTLLDGTTNGITFTNNTAASAGSSVSTASALNVAGTNTFIGGSIEISAGGIWTNNTGSTLAPTDILIVGGTLTCNNSVMDVLGDLTLGPSGNGLFGGTFNGNTGTINIAGDLTTNAGGSMPSPAFNPGTGTFNFNGTTAQSISGTLTPSFNNLTDSNTTQPLTASISFPVGGTLNVNGANAVFAPAAAAIISGSGTLTGTGTAQVTRTAATPDFLSQYTIANKTLTNLTVDYAGAGAQTINNAPTYSSLRISGTGTKALQGATSATANLTIAAAVLDVSASNFGLNIGGNWTNSVGATGFTPRNGTVTFNGTTGTQTLSGTTTFFDLTLNNSGATTGFGSSAITISHNLTTTAGTMAGGTSTITFTGNPGAISGATAKNFNNLVINSLAVISNTTGGNTVILNDYTNNGTFTQAPALTTTFSTGADGAHSFSGSGTTTFGNITINSANTVDAGSHNFNVVGASFTVDGTFTGNTSTVTFNGAVAQAILGTGSKNFNGLTINNANGVTVNNVASTVDATVIGTLTLTTNLTVASGGILQQSGASAGAGDAIGTVRRTDLGATTRAFGNPNVTIAIDSGTAPNPMDVTLAMAAPPDFTTSVTRTYTLTPTGGSGISATLKLHYLDAQLNGNTEAKLGLWKNISGVWTSQGRTGAVDTVNNAVTLSGVTSFSDWTLADQPDVSVAVSPSSVLEDSGTGMVYTFTRTGSTAGPLTVNFSVGGTATFNTDYTQTGAATFTASSGTVTFGSGNPAATVTIAPTADTTVEPNETVILNVVMGLGYNIGAPAAATGTIVNDDTDVSVAVSPSSVAEDGAANLVYTFTRAGVTAGALTVNFSVGGTATLATDFTQTGAATFTATTGTVTFGAGSTTALVTVDPAADTTVEPDETVILTVVTGTGYNIGAPSVATGTITNDDTDVTVAVSPASVAEDGGTNLVYTFTRAGVITNALTVNFSVAGTTTFNTDYTQTGAATFTSSTGTMGFGAGISTAVVTVDPTADTTVEPDETLILTVTAGTGYNVAIPNAATGTITNDDTNVTVAVSPASVLEDGATNQVYTFTRAGVTTGALTINFSVGGTATFNTDYTQTGAATFTASTGTVMFTTDNTTAAVTIDPTADTAFEPDETVILTVTSGTGYAVGAPAAATGTITNDDTEVSVAVSPGSVTEDGAPNLVYTFTRQGIITGALTANFTVGGTATPPGGATPDYSQTGAATFATTTGTVTFGAGNATAIVTIDPAADNTVEPDETVVLTVTAGTGYTVGALSSATGTIANDDADVSVAVSTSAGPGTAVPEDGATNLLYTFTRTGLTAGALTVNFSVGGTATPPGGAVPDFSQSGAATFTTTTGTVTFGAGNLTVTVTVDPIADALGEADETVVLSLTAGTGYNVVAPSSGTGTIVNDDTAVSVAISPTAVAEDGAANMTYTFTRTGDTSTALLVNFSVGGTATLNTDYAESGADSFTASTGTITIPIGFASASLSVDPTPDITVEADETVILTVVAGSGYAPGPPNPATGTILNDDTDVTLAVSPASVLEDGASNLVYTFTRSGVTAGALTVNFTVSGTAALGTDYTQSGAGTFSSSAGTVTFGVGNATAAVTVDPTADTTVEPDETVALALAAGAGYNIGIPNTATGTITNDDTDVSLVVSPSSVAEDGAPNLVYTFTRSGVTANPLTVNFSVSGTATFSSDYTQSGAATFTASSGTVTFLTGNSTATVTIDPTAELTPEPDETATLTLTAGTGYSIVNPNTATGTILNDDTDVTVGVSPSSVMEDGATNLVYTFSRTGVTTGPLTVNFSVGGSATFSSDYTQSGAASFTTSNGTVSFGAGIATVQVTIDPSADLTVEPDETVILTITAGTGYNPGAGSAATGTIVNDDTDVSVTVLPSMVAENSATGMVYTFARTGVTTGALTANFSVGGSATFSTDYGQSGAASFTASSGTVTFGAGSSTATVTVTPIMDSTVEPDETVILTVTSGAGYNVAAPASATGTITNDDTDVTLSISGSPVSEAGPNLTYTFTRSGVTTGALTVNFSVGGSATFTIDYTQAGAATFGSSSGTVTITAGSGTAMVTLTPVNDALVEGNETAILTLSSGSGYNVGSPSVATGTITDNDTATIAFAVSASNAPEQTASHNVGVTLAITANGAGTPMLGRVVSVNVQDLQSGTATGGGVDYTYASPQTVTFNVNDAAQTKNVSIGIVNDSLSEGNETINLALNTLVDNTGGQVSLASPTADTVTIVDNDIDLRVTKTESADPVAAGGGPGNLTYTVKVKNTGLTGANGVTMSEALTLPSGVTVDSVMVNAGSVSGSSPNYKWNIGSLGVNVEATLTAVLTVGAGTAAGTNVICDTAAITASTENRVNIGDDTATECTSVVAQADLEIISKTDVPDPVCVGGDITYTISFRNNGPGPGINSKVIDAVPTNTTFVSATVTSGMVWGISGPSFGQTGNVMFTRGSVANGETATFQVVVRVSAGTVHGTVITNTATASSDLMDPVAGNNSKTATTTVDPIAPVFTNGCQGAISVAAQAGCPFSSAGAVNYATPGVSDNCPGATVACVPPSGSMFPVGTTTVTCTATDTAGNAAVCSFPVTVFSLCLQDNSNPGNVVLIDTSTGAYRFCCNGTLVASGTGTRNVRGCTVSITGTSNNHIVQILVDGSSMKGTASIKQGATILCMISDNNMQNNTCVCQ